MADLTNQPEEYIKQILRDVGQYNHTGPRRGMWQLKPEYSSYAETETSQGQHLVRKKKYSQEK